MKAFEGVLEHIEQGLVSGRYRVGSVLPPERELAAQLGVSRSAVREAVRVLQAQGVLDSVVGTGPRSGTRVTARQTAALSRLLRMHVTLGLYPIAQVVESRIMLERASVAAAARHASMAQLARIADVVVALDAATEMEEYNVLDTTFHVRLAEVGDNRLVTDLTVAVREALMRPIAEASDALASWSDLRRTLDEQHHAIFDAVAAREPDAAADAVERHIRSSYTRLGLHD